MLLCPQIWQFSKFSLQFHLWQKIQDLMKWMRGQENWMLPRKNPFPMKADVVLWFAEFLTMCNRKCQSLTCWSMDVIWVHTCITHFPQVCLLFLASKEAIKECTHSSKYFGVKEFFYCKTFSSICWLHCVALIPKSYVEWLLWHCGIGLSENVKFCKSVMTHDNH